MKLPERNESLWLLIVSPVIWATHFLLCYITAAIWCAKFVPRDGSLEPVRWAIAGYTAVALAGIGWNGWSGYWRHRFGSGSQPYDADTPEDRHRFLGFATLLLAALSAISTLFSALVALFFKDCQ